MMYDGTGKPGYWVRVVFSSLIIINISKMVWYSYSYTERDIYRIRHIRTKILYRIINAVVLHMILYSTRVPRCAVPGYAGAMYQKKLFVYSIKYQAPKEDVVVVMYVSYELSPNGSIVKLKGGPKRSWEHHTQWR